MAPHLRKWREGDLAPRILIPESLLCANESRLLGFCSPLRVSRKLPLSAGALPASRYPHTFHMDLGESRAGAFSQEKPPWGVVQGMWRMEQVVRCRGSRLSLSPSSQLPAIGTWSLEKHAGTSALLCTASVSGQPCPQGLLWTLS